MDHQRAFNRLKTESILSVALDFAVYDRINGDHFYDPFEIEFALSNRNEIISEIIDELNDPESFNPRGAIAYFPPKNDLCDRRMVYIPIKDITIRYGIALLLSEEIEHEIHPQCFANRRPQDDQSNIRFTEDFATGGWSRFCEWQNHQCENHNVLLKTDISSFYDSISHNYLLDAVCRHFDLSRDCRFILIFEKLLEIPVLYYSPRTRQIEGPSIIHQGLPIGDGVEGYLANIFLKDVDDAMVSVNASYGRYVDDIRIFGDSRAEVIRNLSILQEELLRKGINLNSSKTEIAENPQELGDLISRVFYLGDYYLEESESAGRTLDQNIDRPFEDFDRTFEENEIISSGKDSKDFCKFLSAHHQNGAPLLPICDRQQWHVDRLRDSIMSWRGAAKHAAWLLVQTAVYRGVPSTTGAHARTTLFTILQDETVSSYTRYRILHHLTKLRSNRAGENFRFLNQFDLGEIQILRDLVPGYISAPAFELNITGLYLSRVLGATPQQLRSIVTTSANPHCQPLRNTLANLSRIPDTSPPNLATEIEPDSRSQQY